MEYVILNNGIEMPKLGFGVFQISDQEECEQCVISAVETGYRLIDTASVYKNEEAVGKAIKNCGLNREEIFLTTKIWPADYGFEKTKKAFEVSLSKLNVDYIDLYLLHQPYNDIFGAWRAMEELYQEGKIRAIGISNFHPDRVMDLIVNSEIAPAINQIETHPFHQQISAQEFLVKNNVQIESWGPFAEGRNDIFQNSVLQAIANKHEKSIAQIILRWLMQRNVIAIPKSVRKDRMAENINVFDFILDDLDMADIAKLDTNQSLFFDHRDPEMVNMLCRRY